LLNSIIYVLHIATARTVCGVKLRLNGVSDKRTECGVINGMTSEQNEVF